MLPLQKIKLQFSYIVRDKSPNYKKKITITKNKAAIYDMKSHNC